MMTKKYNEDIPPCDLCGMHFSDAFEYVKHMLEDDDDFNPYLILPNSYRLMVGSKLRTLFDNADDPTIVRQVCESTYMTLFTAETEPHMLEEVITDLIVESSIADLDEDIKRILEDRE